MVSHLLYYQLALLAIIWLFVMLPLPESKPSLPAPPVPVKPNRKRSTEPKAFEGLTHKPHCVLCGQETGETNPPPPVRPDPMPRTNRRPRTVDTSMHFCPHSNCDYRGWLGLNNLRANGHPNGGPWRQFQCTACEGYFPEHHGTMFHGKQVAVELIVRVLACLAEGLGIRATARVFEVAPHTVLHWLVEAAEQLQAFSSYFLCEVHVQQLQLDELYAVLSADAKAAHRVSARKRRSTISSRSSVQSTRLTACPVVAPSGQSRWATQGSTCTSRWSPRDKMALSQIVLTQPTLRPCQFPWMGKWASNNVGRPIHCICSSNSGMSSTRSVMMFGISCMPRA
jgi:transposase-like protein